MQGCGPSLAFKLIVASRVVVGSGRRRGIAIHEQPGWPPCPSLCGQQASGWPSLAFTVVRVLGAWPCTSLFLAPSMPDALTSVREFSVWTASISIDILLDAGNLLGLAISPLMLARYGWRGLFCIFGILGGPLLAFWQAVVPARHSEGMMQLPQMPLISQKIVALFMLSVTLSLCLQCERQQHLEGRQRRRACWDCCPVLQPGQL